MSHITKITKNAFQSCVDDLMVQDGFRTTRGRNQNDALIAILAYIKTIRVSASKARIVKFENPVKPDDLLEIQIVHSITQWELVEAELETLRSELKAAHERIVKLNLEYFSDKKVSNQKIQVI